MKKPMRISLRAGERIYVNGAVLQVDRKVGLDLINEVSFLLQSQVMQVSDATTPLRQLYFIVQLMLMSPNDVADAKSLYHEHRCAILLVTENEDVKAGLEAVEELVEAKRYYDALRKIRGLFDIEQSILSGAPVLDAAQVA